MIQLKRLVLNLSWPEDGNKIKGRFINNNDSVEETSLEFIMTRGWK